METALQIKLAVIFALLAIFVSLGIALVRLVRNRGDPAATVKALTWRIVLSLLLFVLIILCVATGLIIPRGI